MKKKGIDPLPSGNFRWRLNYEGAALSGVEATEELAESVRAETLRQLIDGDLRPARDVTLASVGGKFLASRKGNRDKKSDSGRWENVTACAIARVPLVDMGRNDVLDWIDELEARETRDRRPLRTLKWESRRKTVNLARCAFRFAMDRKLTAATLNPFVGVTVERKDGDEDDGYQEGWYLDTDEQERLLRAWASLEEPHQAKEHLIAAIAIGTGLRLNELFCAHIQDVVTEGREPHIHVRFGSYDRKEKRFRAPKGRRGEKKPRVVPLFGRALDAMREWKTFLPNYAASNPMGLMFPTPRGRLRNQPPRCWKAVVEKFGVVPRIGRTVWWHLLRHTCASSMISGAWGMRWSLEDVCKILGHTDIRTTQRYAHHLPKVVHVAAARAEAMWTGPRLVTSTVTRSKPDLAKRLNSRYARSESNGRHSASKSDRAVGFHGEFACRDDVVTAIVEILRAVARGQVALSNPSIDALTDVLDSLLAEADSGEIEGSR